MVANFGQRRTGDRVAQLFETFYIGGAHEVQVDRQGRILIPPKLREFAGLGRDATFSAKHNRFQLWDRATLERILKSAEDQLLADPDLLAKSNFRDRQMCLTAEKGQGAANRKHVAVMLDEVVGFSALSTL